MPRSICIALKKQPKQQRAIATVDAIVEAATYILTRGGPRAFTANKVAERAGVNISSFYQYFPNKEALLFHITKLTWDAQMARLAPILAERDTAHAQRLRRFIREFFLVESAEVDLRRALKLASVDLKDTPEHQALLSEGAAAFKAFLQDAMRPHTSIDLDFAVDFAAIAITSFAERSTDLGNAGELLVRQADVLSEMLINRLGIN